LGQQLETVFMEEKLAQEFDSAKGLFLNEEQTKQQ
jgi:hypothetical protein